MMAMYRTNNYRCIMCHTLVIVPIREQDETVTCPGCGRLIPAGILQKEEISGLCDRCKKPIDDCKY